MALLGVDCSLPSTGAPAVVAKTKFSMCTEEVDAALNKLPGVSKVLVVGIETHVCVLQTSLDLLGALRWAVRDVWLELGWTWAGLGWWGPGR